MRKSQQRMSRHRAWLLKTQLHKAAKLKGRWWAMIARPLKKSGRWNRRQKRDRMLALGWIKAERD